MSEQPEPYSDGEIRAREDVLHSLHAEAEAKREAGRQRGRPQRVPRNGRAAGGQTPKMSDDELLQRARRAQNGPKVSALLAGDRSGYTSESEADLALADELAFWTYDGGQIERVMRGSGLAREKWDKHRTYLRDTIAKAQADCTEHYVPVVPAPRAYYGQPHARRNGAGDHSGGGHGGAGDVPKGPTGPTDFYRVAAADGGEPLTDLGNSERLVRYYGQYIRYSPALGWLVWDGRRFVRDDGMVVDFAKLTVRNIYGEAQVCDPKIDKRSQALGTHAMRSEAAPRIQAMVSLAQSARSIQVSPDELDADKLALNCLNGTVDLGTGKLRPHDPGDLITRLAPVRWEPGAEAPLWRTYLESTFAGNAKLIAFVQRCVGYGLTGLTSEECFFMLWGRGRNGKGTLIDTMHDLLGDYASSCPIETFLQRRGDTIPNDLAMLAGRRFVTTSELDKGRSLAEARMKQLTGGDPVSARFLRREFFDYMPIYKIFMAVNDKPSIRGSDVGIWSRIYLIPFVVTFHREDEAGEPKRDKHLKEKLRAAELPGILQWAYEGYRAWRELGLGPPDEVRAATVEYRGDMDRLSGFFEECCEVIPNLEALPEKDVQMSGVFTTAAALYEAYLKWAEGEHEKPMSKKALGMLLKEKGFVRASGTDNVRMWFGLRPK